MDVNINKEYSGHHNAVCVLSSRSYVLRAREKKKHNKHNVMLKWCHSVLSSTYQIRELNRELNISAVVMLMLMLMMMTIQPTRCRCDVKHALNESIFIDRLALFFR